MWGGGGGGGIAAAGPLDDGSLAMMGEKKRANVFVSCKLPGKGGKAMDDL